MLYKKVMEEILLKKPIRILCLEDNECDRELLEITLKANSMDCEFVHAKTQKGFESALEQNTFDLIISDFSLPAYDGMTALTAARKVQAETPFIFFSGTIGEERAIESLKSGATDYVLKDRRDRLITAVQRALREAREHAERKQLAEQLRQAQKMEAIGQLAGGVAHDFNNLLAVIQGNAELALMNASTLDDQTRENLTQITAASERAANLTRQLLAFGRKQAIRSQPLNLNDGINNLAKMLRRIIGEHICLQCNCDPAPLFVQADVSMMDQVILNLVVNARDAMPQGGQLIISTEKVGISEPYVRLHQEAQTGEFVCLSVSDTGCGIAPEYLPRIFEPFFTTKEVGKGTGLGLATIYGIVKQHHGWIDLSSKVGVGTTFKVFLPAIPSPAATATPPEVEPASLGGGTERILLVEDEAAVRLMTRRILRKFGYQVIEAASGREALEIWRSQGTGIDLLLTDVVMPDGINGRDLAEQLRRQTPGLKVVFMSGYSLNVISKDTDFLNRDNNYFLQKPCHSQILIDTVRRCLNKATSPVA
ncbi:MAG: histidine kinase [Pedosphaera sp.]|nr:histidine kinase [Pedosphaera sp.]